MEAEAEAVDGKLKEAEAEAKEKLTAVASLVLSVNVVYLHLIFKSRDLVKRICFSVAKNHCFLYYIVHYL